MPDKANRPTAPPATHVFRDIDLGNGEYALESLRDDVIRVGGEAFLP